MIFTVIWTEAAFITLRSLRSEDPPGAAVVAQAVSGLAEDQQPKGSAQLGSTDLRRLRIGSYRVLYEIDETNGSVMVHSVGRVRTGRPG
jgi:mRNA interferase RelE/StbE